MYLVGEALGESGRNLHLGFSLIRLLESRRSGPYL